MMESPALCILEDDKRFRETLALEFRDRGYNVFEAESLIQLHEILKKGPMLRFAVVDLRIKADRGLDALPMILANSPQCRVVILTGYGSIVSAVEAVKIGAVNYLPKPVDIIRLERALWTDEPEKEDVTDATDEQAGESLARHEREYIEYVLQKCNGNVTQAAKWLGLHRQSLQRKLRKFPPK